MQREKQTQGFSYIEIIISSGVLLILAHAFFTLLTTAYQFIGISRIHSSARALANQQIELIRNLPYDDVGTTSGIPSGLISPVQTITLNGQPFQITTNITYVDNPYDNLAPADTYAADYKKANVRVSWTGTFPSEEIIESVTDITPKGVESNTTGGTLNIIVSNSNGDPVTQADILIEAPTQIPPISMNVFTDSNGQLSLPGTPTCTACYNITVTKNGYSTDKTYSTSDVINPFKPPVTILDGQVSQISFAIDQISTTTITSVNQGPTYTPSSNQTFRLIGNKSIGTDADGTTIYKYNQSHTTDGAGQISLDLEWGQYTLQTDATTTDLAAISPLPPTVQIYPNTSQNITYIPLAHSTHSLLIAAKEASGTAIPEADVTLNKTGYNQTQQTGPANQPDAGQTFFSNLDAGTYSLEIIKAGYTTYTDTINIDGSLQEIITMSP